MSLGLAVGAVTFFVADQLVDRLGSGDKEAASIPLPLGALLEGIPEQAVLGIGIAGGGSVSPVLLTAIFVSNLPEAIESANDLRAAGHRIKASSSS